MTGISWCDETWNPVIGCSPVSPGCRRCYAVRVGARLERCGLDRYKGLVERDPAGRLVWTGRVRLVPDVLARPLDWRRPRYVFVCSMGDLFHERVPTAWIDAVWSVMEAARDHVFLVLTKRPGRMAAYAAERDDHGLEPLRNVYLGTSIETPGQLRRLDDLLAAPAALRWISAEPLLADLAPALAGRVAALDAPPPRWVVAGGESGPGAVPCPEPWVRGLRDLCRDWDVPFHFEQWGGGRGTRELDGREWDELPRAPLNGSLFCRRHGCAAPPDVLVHGLCRGCLRQAREVTLPALVRRASRLCESEVLR